ncbi:TetR/AcrR family transcriptional regulator [Salipiger mucosus]|uniref:Transcriptional regulator, TetR family n=1 Tax=Salipiger mucosus DSM 16094 TaxID=1123237 RepID=S9RE36_9RHOB|nr:TetR/AcrR family transcriptional regulator [Salipiger mucosus]EPX76390.1 Transcriptional regulator, TetR family [Salipiger mucosus DSM 16094]
MTGLIALIDWSILMSMVHQDTRSALISAGLRAMLHGGYDSVGIAGVLTQTGVPKGSFYHYFDSKEAFGCAIVVEYGERWRAIRRTTFERTDLSPLDRLDRHFDELEDDVMTQKVLSGCLLGNLSQLLASRSEPLRQAIEAAFDEWQEDLSRVLETALQVGELPNNADPDETAALVIEAYEGALLRAKAQASRAPLVRFRTRSLPLLLGK